MVWSQSLKLLFPETCCIDGFLQPLVALDSVAWLFYRGTFTMISPYTFRREISFSLGPEDVLIQLKSSPGLEPGSICRIHDPILTSDKLWRANNVVTDLWGVLAPLTMSSLEIKVAEQVIEASSCWVYGVYEQSKRNHCFGLWRTREAREEVVGFGHH